MRFMIIIKDDPKTEGQMPPPGGTTRMFPNVRPAQRRKAKRSTLRLNSSAMLRASASLPPA